MKMLLAAIGMTVTVGFAESTPVTSTNTAPRTAAATVAAEAPEHEDSPTVIVVIGAPGEEEYGSKFAEEAQRWESTCRTAGARYLSVGPSGQGSSELEQLKTLLQNEPKQTSRELWIVLLGHGTFDGKEAKFNLRGSDLSATDLAEWLKAFQRPLAVINTSSASSPFLTKLSGSDRVVITATRSGYEQNYTRFGPFFTAALSNLDADLDKDGQVSLLEAFLMAANQVNEFYKTEGRLATEHALLDDNGDGRGTPPDWFRGIRAIKKAADDAPLDGLRAHQWHLVRSESERRLSPALRTRRNELEIAIEALRQTKGHVSVDEYYQRLEPLLLELARLYQSSETPP